MFTVYALYNPERSRIYVGQTSDLEKRLKRHRALLPTKINSFTKKLSGTWEVVYSENHTTRSEAWAREKQLKSAKGREFVWTIVCKDRP